MRDPGILTEGVCLNDKRALCLQHGQKLAFSHGDALGVRVIPRGLKPVDQDVRAEVVVFHPEKDREILGIMTGVLIFAFHLAGPMV